MPRIHSILTPAEVGGRPLVHPKSARRQHESAGQPTGDDVVLQTTELAESERKNIRLDPEELGLLAGQLVDATNPVKAAWIRERLTRGYYGI